MRVCPEDLEKHAGTKEREVEKPDIILVFLYTLIP
jgi:hypothetical protein